MKKISIIILTTILYSSLYAIPAYRGPIEITQPDGTTITVYQYGDENFHYMTLADGTWVERDETGMLVPIEQLSKMQISQRHATSRHKVVQKAAGYPLNIAPRGLIILISYADLEFYTSKAEIDSMINGQHYTRNYQYQYKEKNQIKTLHITSEGSARQYFIDQSWGKYQPEFDVVGPVKVSGDCSYYGRNDRDGNDMYAEDLLVEACTIAHNELGVDFSKYDCDNDGEIDFVYMLYAGYGEADGGENYTIWPHSWNLVDNYYVRTAAGGRGKSKVYLNGKLLNNYACSNELDYNSKQHSGIGTFCHEFGHVLGLPDLYDTSGNNYTLGDWDIMDYGSYNNDGNTPPAYSAYERFFLGWLKPTVLNTQGNIILPELNENKTAALISSTGQHNLIGNNPTPAEFYLLENRQQQGWDKYLPGEGMLITKIKYDYNRWLNNIVNNTASNMGVDIQEADGRASEYGDAKDAFPAGATYFTPYSKYPITNITMTDGIISFDFMGGGDSIVITKDNYLTAEEHILAIYTLQGQVLPVETHLSSGIYIVVTDKSVRKISVK